MARKSEIIYGVHAVDHVLKHSSEDVLEVYLTDSKKISKEIDAILRIAGNAGISVQRISRDAMASMTGDAVHQGIAVKRRSRKTCINDLQSLLDSMADDVPLLLVLDGVQDPHNLGACLRTANAAGVNAIIIPRDKSVSVNATVRKIASGAAEHTPVIAVTNLARTLEQLKQHGVWCFGLAEDAGLCIYDTDLNVPLALVLGSEGKGLRLNTSNHCDQLVHVPMKGEVESLNVSVTAAVCLYETLRQRSCK